MESAKFCGNCGNPFTRPSEPTSSLVNCPQGHVYSAVYQYCPYCPQPATDEASNFATRIEEPVTAIDPHGSATVSSKAQENDFATKIEFSETLVEPPEATASPVVFAPTEVISATPAFDRIVESPITPEPVKKAPVTEVSAIPASVPTNQEPIQFESSPQKVQAEPQPPAAALFQAPATEQNEIDRRTIVVSDQDSPEQGTKGKIVGWLISYTRNPDGDDFRVYAGYNRMGANPVCDIVVEDETVSGSHAILVYRDGRCLIKDDLSRNGTFVNGREITEAYPLQNYDQIRVGNTILTYVAAQP